MCDFEDVARGSGWKKRTPLANLFVEMVNRAGIPTEKFGPSDGGLSDLG